MGVFLQITSTKVGEMLMLEHKIQQGRSTRDTSDVVLGDRVYHYGVNGECPPSRVSSPYRGMWHEYGDLPHALRIYEPRASGDPKYALSTVRGIGTVLRRGVLIHEGPARSEGCFTMENYAEFRTTVEHYLAVERAKELIVHVLPRYFGNENPLSSQ
jgi:hypothetical protein